MKRIASIFVLILILVFFVGCENVLTPFPEYNMITYHVSYYYENPEGLYLSQDMESESFTVRKNTSVTVKAKSVEFFYCRDSEKTSILNSEQTFYFYYTRNQFTIHFLDSLTGNMQLNAKHGKAITLPIKTSNEFEFVGWSFDSQGNEIANITIMPTRNLTLYAIWN